MLLPCCSSFNSSPLISSQHLIVAVLTRLDAGTFSCFAASKMNFLSASVSRRFNVRYLNRPFSYTFGRTVLPPFCAFIVPHILFCVNPLMKQSCTNIGNIFVKCVYIKHHPYSFMSLMSTPYASHRLRNGTAGILLPLRSHRQTVEGSTSANSAACASEYPAFTLAAFNVIFISSHHPIIFVCAFQVVSAFSVCQRVFQSPALYNSQRSMSDRRTLSDCVLLLTTLQQ